MHSPLLQGLEDQTSAQDTNCWNKVWFCVDFERIKRERRRD